MAETPKKFRRLKGSYEELEKLKTDLLNSSLAPEFGWLCCGYRNRKVFLALNEQKDWKHTRNLNFLNSISHWRTNDSLENFAEKNVFQFYPLLLT